MKARFVQPRTEDATNTLRKCNIKADKAVFTLKTTVEDDV